MSEVENEILTLEEVAAYLKAGKRTVYRLAQKRGKRRHQALEVPAGTHDEINESKRIADSLRFEVKA